MQENRDLNKALVETDTMFIVEGEKKEDKEIVLPNLTQSDELNVGTESSSKQVFYYEENNFALMQLIDSEF